MDKKRRIGELAVQYILVQGLLSTVLMLVNCISPLKVI